MRWTGILLMSAVLAAGCGRGGLFGATSPTPTPTFGDDDDDDTGLPTTTPDFGDGQDGPVDIDGQDVTVNECVSVLSGSKNTVVLAGPMANVEVGDRVLLLQVQDAATSSTLASAGRWDIVDVVALTPQLDQLGTTDLLHTYVSETGTRAAQACIMPQYTSVQLRSDARFRASAWDGATGGVVAFYVSGELLFDSDEGRVGDTGRGFRGGALGPDDVTANVADDFAAFGPGGGKGEGLNPAFFHSTTCSATVPDTCYGRGAVVLGGGGGNGLNAGGGGGSHVGVGGQGGTQTTAQNPDTNGRAGTPVSVSGAFRLLFGGGGGAGQQDQTAGEPGHPGGGVTIVFAQSLRGAGRIRARGENGNDSDEGGSDGGGGGGAGGTVLVWTDDASMFTGDLRVDGGRGDYVRGAVHNGPGGGGGGGRILVNSTLSVSNVIVVGGPNGQSDGPGGTDDWQALPGGDGIPEEITSIPINPL